MHDDAKAVIEGLMAAWWRQDAEAVLCHFADSIFYTVHEPESMAEHEARIVGKSQMRIHLHDVRATWQFLYLAPMTLVANGQDVRGQVMFLSVHRRTGLRYSGTKRFEWRVEDGLVIECAKFHDCARLKAFLASAEAS